METEVAYDNIFQFPQSLVSLTGGCSRIDTMQVLPSNANISDATIGSPQTSSEFNFDFGNETDAFWMPEESYFEISMKVVKYVGTPAVFNAIPDTEPITYVDNPACTLFSTVKTFINGLPLDIVDTPHVVDTVLTYANTKYGFIKSFGSSTRIGEGLMTRIANVKSKTGSATDAPKITVVFRPPCALFATKLIPPGAKFRVSFNFAPTARLCLEWASNYKTDGTTMATPVLGTSNGQYNVLLSNFYFYRATVHPGLGTELPFRGLIELSPAICNQFVTNKQTAVQQNFNLPGTTNRIMVCFQDNNQAVDATNGILKGGAGTLVSPSTSFTTSFFNGTNDVYLTQLYISIGELSLMAPSPIYDFSGLTSGDYSTLSRAYIDFINCVQGTCRGSEGSVPFGNPDYKPGVSIQYTKLAAVYAAGPPITVTLDKTGSVFQPGNPNNPEEYKIVGLNLAGDPVATTAAQTCKWGWSGRCPGPIFGFSIIRPNNKLISNMTLNYRLGTDAQVIAYVISSYSMALAVENKGNGIYTFSFVEGA